MKVIDSICHVTQKYTDSQAAMENEAKYKEILDSNISRIEKWVNNKEIAVLTAFREALENVANQDKTLLDKPIDGAPEERKYSKKENRERNRALKAALLRNGYGVTKVSGIYPEVKNGVAVPKAEESFMVVNLQDNPNFKSDIAQLSEWFNQDSYLYKPKGEAVASLVGTNSAWPGYGEVVLIGSFLKSVKGDFMTKLGNRGFAFTDNPDDYSAEDKSDTWQARKDKRVNHKLDDSAIQGYFVGDQMGSQFMGMYLDSIVEDFCKSGKLPKTFRKLKFK